MDPNKALENLREALKSGEHEESAEAAAALDEWLSKGGFLPDAWRGAAADETAPCTCPGVSGPDHEGECFDNPACLGRNCAACAVGMDS